MKDRQDFETGSALGKRRDSMVGVAGVPSVLDLSAGCCCIWFAAGHVVEGTHTGTAQRQGQARPAAEQACFCLILSFEHLLDRQKEKLPSYPSSEKTTTKTPPHPIQCPPEKLEKEKDKSVDWTLVFFSCEQSPSQHTLSKLKMDSGWHGAVCSLISRQFLPHLFSLIPGYNMASVPKSKTEKYYNNISKKKKRTWCMPLGLPAYTLPPPHTTLPHPHQQVCMAPRF